MDDGKEDKFYWVRNREVQNINDWIKRRKMNGAVMWQERMTTGFNSGDFKYDFKLARGCYPRDTPQVLKRQFGRKAESPLGRR